MIPGPKRFEGVVMAWPQHSFSKHYSLTDLMLQSIRAICYSLNMSGAFPP